MPKPIRVYQWDPNQGNSQWRQVRVMAFCDQDAQKRETD